MNIEVLDCDRYYHVRGHLGCVVIPKTSSSYFLFSLSLLVRKAGRSLLPYKGEVGKLYRQIHEEYANNRQITNVHTSLKVSGSDEIPNEQTISQDQVAVDALVAQLRSGQYKGLIEFVEPNRKMYDSRLVFSVPEFVSIPVRRIIIPENEEWRAHYTIRIICDGVDSAG